MTKQPTSPSRSDDFPGGLGGGEPRMPADHRVGETTRQDPRVTDVDPAPQQGPAAPDPGRQRKPDGSG